MANYRMHRSTAFLFFKSLIRYRWFSLIAALLVIGGLGSQLGELKKNTQADAFIDANEPALIYRSAVEDIFNLKDPLVIAIQNGGATGIYNTESLELVRRLSDQLISVPNIDPQGITSLATESNIEGDSFGMEVREFLDGPLDSAHIDWIKASIESFPLYQGSLVADDGSMTLIVAELLDQKKAEATYQAVMQLIEHAPAGENEIHVAGEGAIAGFLSEYIDRDAKRLNPLAGLIITIVLIAAFFTVRAAVIPNLIVAGTVAGTLGAMAVFGAEFYVITNGLIVCMIGIAVADSIHIFSEYYEVQAADPTLSQGDAVALAMARMWRPVALTTLTTAAGFLALYPTNDMPPLQYFGIFGAFAVVVAGILTLFVTPALLSFFRARPSRLFRRQGSVSSKRSLARVLGSIPVNHPKKVLLSGTLIAGLAVVIGAVNVVVNEERIENFQAHEPIYLADKSINRSMDGTYYLDVVIETPDAEGIYDPSVLTAISELQDFLEQQPEIHGSTSIADYIKQMYKAVNEDDQAFYRLPDDRNLIAQLFLLYTASGDPTDFEERVDSRRETALVRANLKTGSYQVSRSLIPRLESYLAAEFDGEVSAQLSGRINVDYHWIDGIAESHLDSVIVSFLAVFLMAALLFRSIVGGLMAAIPVGLSILLIYAVMGVKGIWLGVGTSMFAAIAIGLSVDFAIHTIDRLREAMSQPGDSNIAERITDVFASTGRALWFNLLAVALGFGVLMTSQVPPLVNFGMLVALSVSVAFVASLFLLPAFALVFRPKFVHGAYGSFWRTGTILLVLLAAGVLSGRAFAAEGRPEADDIIQKMNDRPEGVSVQRDMSITLTDRRGNVREEHTRAFRRYFGDTKKTAIFYTKPGTVAGTAFLTWDYADPGKDDDQWLYLPALRKVRRISASDRGDYFLGTDFTYEEIKKESKIAAEDYQFSLLGEEDVDGHHAWKIEATPVDPEVSRALGYGRVVLRIDSSLWIPRLTEYWDVNGNFLKTVHARGIENIDGIWAITDIEATNQKTGHSTRIQFQDTDYGAPVPPRLFEQNALKRGF